MPNLKQASKKSIYNQLVNQLDDFGSNPNEFTQPTELIEAIAGSFVERVHSNINKEKDFVVTGKIADITIKAENNAVNIYANPWLVYQDRGVNGSKSKLYKTPHAYTDKMPPVQVFKDWIKEKGLRLEKNEPYGKFEDKNYEAPFKEVSQEEQINSRAWAIAKTVFKEGFKPRNILSKEYPLLLKELQENIKDFAVQQILQKIDVKDSAKRIIIGKKKK